MMSEGVFIEFLLGRQWKVDAQASGFENADQALVYIQEHLTNYPNTYLRIGIRCFHVRADGLYHMTNRHGWQKFEAVQS